MISQFRWYRRAIGGKWGKVTRLTTGKKWVHLPKEAEQYDEIWIESRELVVALRGMIHMATDSRCHGLEINLACDTLAKIDGTISEGSL